VAKFHTVYECVNIGYMREVTHMLDALWFWVEMEHLHLLWS